jgi:hypothetical protein
MPIRMGNSAGVGMGVASWENTQWGKGSGVGGLNSYCTKEGESCRYSE